MPTAAWPIGLPRHLAYPDVALDTVLISAAASYPDRIALRDNENQLTYGELLTQARHVAGGLRARGIHSGDVIALHMPNSVWFAVAYYGALLAGRRWHRSTLHSRHPRCGNNSLMYALSR